MSLRIIKTLLAQICGLCVLLGSSGCSMRFHSDAPATQIYVLRAAPPAATDRAVAPTVSVRVARPTAVPGLSSDHIMLVQSDHRLSYFTASRWPAGLPEVVEALAAETLRASGNWRVVEDSGGTFPSDYVLQIVIRRFEADYTAHPQTPEIHVALECTLGKRASRDVVATFVAEGSALAAANRLGEVVAAFETAARQALASLAEQTLRAVPSS